MLYKGDSLHSAEGKVAYGDNVLRIQIDSCYHTSDAFSVLPAPQRCVLLAAWMVGSALHPASASAPRGSTASTATKVTAI